MACERYLNAIQELTDGTLGPLRRSELELHLETCDDCRALAGDLRAITESARSLDPRQPPDRVWENIAGRLREQGAAASPSRTAGARSYALLALAATLVLAVAGAIALLLPARQGTPAAAPTQAAAPQPAADNADLADPVQSFDAELAKTDAQLTRVYEQASKLDDVVDPATKADIQKNLLVMNEAARDIRARLKTDPDDAVARQSLYETLRQKIQFLQDTIALMNEMRQGDAAGAAEIVEGGKS